MSGSHRSARVAHPSGAGEGDHRCAPQDLTGIVVVNFRSAELIERHLGALQLDRTRFAVVVVDSFSSQAQRERIAGVVERFGWSLVALSANPGFGGAANAGARRARELGARTVLLLNPDAVATEDVLAALHDGVASDPATILTPRLRSPARGTVFSGSVVELRSGRIRAASSATVPAVAWLPATCLAVDLDAFERLGGFDERFFMYWEDVDFSIRAARAGLRLTVRDDLEVIHDSGGTQSAAGTRAKSPLYYRYNCRNRLVFGARTLGRGDLLRWILHTPQVSWSILMQGGRRQLLRSPRVLFAALAGSFAGLARAVPALAQRQPTHDPCGHDALNRVAA